MQTCTHLFAQGKGPKYSKEPQGFLGVGLQGMSFVLQLKTEKRKPVSVRKNEMLKAKTGKKGEALSKS